MSERRNASRAYECAACGRTIRIGDAYRRVLVSTPVTVEGFTMSERNYVKVHDECPAVTS